MDSVSSMLGETRLEVEGATSPGRVAVVGTGNLGRALAARLARAGWQVP